MRHHFFRGGRKGWPHSDSCRMRPVGCAKVSARVGQGAGSRVRYVTRSVARLGILYLFQSLSIVCAATLYRHVARFRAACQCSRAHESLCAMFQPNNSQPGKTVRVSVSRKYARSIAPRPVKERGTALDKATRWLVPWGLYDYPGMRRGIAQLIGGLYAWTTIRDYRTGHRRISGKCAAVFASVIEQRCAVGLAIAAELREIERTYVDGRTKPSGWQVVRDRGGIVTDGRPKRTRRD